MSDLIALAKKHCDFEIDARGRWTFSFDNYGLQAFADLIRQQEMNRCTEIVKCYYNGDHIAKVIESGMNPAAQIGAKA
jgi:hypothetical protein